VELDPGRLVRLEPARALDPRDLERGVGVALRVATRTAIVPRALERLLGSTVSVPVTCELTPVIVSSGASEMNWMRLPPSLRAVKVRACASATEERPSARPSAPVRTSE